MHLCLNNTTSVRESSLTARSRLTRATFFLLLALAAALCGCGEGGKGRKNGKGANGDKPTSTTLEMAKEGSKKREFTVPVRVERIVRGEVKAYASVTGTLAPIRTAPVVSETTGRIFFEQPWEPDDLVKEGQIIARIDDRDIQSEIESREADLENAKWTRELNEAQLKKAQEDLQTINGLVQKELRPQRDLEEALMKIHTDTTTLTKSENQVKKAELSLAQSKKKLEQLFLKAPFDGMLCPREVIEKGAAANSLVANRNVVEYEGRLISSGMTVCGVLDLSEMFVRCWVTSKNISSVEIGAWARVRLRLGEGDIEVRGKVAEISSVIDLQTMAFQVDVVADNPLGQLRPGMFSEVDIVTAIRPDAIAVPRSSIESRNNQDVVFVVEDGYAVMREVEFGIENSEEYEIIEGLKEGDLLVVNGQNTLQDRVRVEIFETVEGDDSKTASSSKKPPKKKPGKKGGKSIVKAPGRPALPASHAFVCPLLSCRPRAA